MQQWLAVMEGQNAIECLWDHGQPKQDEGNEQLVGREEMEERVRGMEIKTGEESKPNTSTSLLRFVLSVTDTGFT